MIPQQLEHQRFIKLRPNSKQPFEKEWNRSNNYDYDTAKEWKSYGVLCGIKGLIVLDCDDAEFDAALLNNPFFEKTFRVRTAVKKLHHYYFYIGNSEGVTTKRITHPQKGNIADVQGNGVQVVGPGTLINDSKYELVNDVSISQVSWEDFVENVKECMREAQVEITKGLTRKNNKFESEKSMDESEASMEAMDTDPVCAYIRNQITIRDVLKDLGVEAIDGENTICPLGHDSVNKKCLSFDKSVFYCFHCRKGGTLFDLWSLAKGVSFIIAKDYWADKVGVPDGIRAEAKRRFKKLGRSKEFYDYISKEVMKKLIIKTIDSGKKSGDREMWYYHDGIYKPNAHTQVQILLKALLGKYSDKNNLNHVLFLIESDTIVREEDFFNKPYEDFIPLLNGIYDLEKKSLKPYTPEMVFFNKLNVVYKENQRSFKVEGFFKDILANDADYKTMQEIFGYCLLKNSIAKKAFIWVGKGDNGKSVALSLIKALFGENNISSIPLQDLDVIKSFDNVELIGKYVNFSADINSTRLANNGNFKTLVSGDTMTAYRKFKSAIQFNNYAKLIFAANKLPDTDDNSDGFFTRWLILDFPYQFKKDASKEEIALGKIKKANPTITKELTGSYHLTALFNWALEGLYRLVENNYQFTNQSDMDELKIKWKRKANSFTAFLNDCVTFTDDEEDIETVDMLKKCYLSYCQFIGLPLISGRERNRILEDNYPSVRKHKPKKGPGGVSTTVRVWTNLKIDMSPIMSTNFK